MNNCTLQISTVQHAYEDKCKIRLVNKAACLAKSGFLVDQTIITHYYIISLTLLVYNYNSITYYYTCYYELLHCYYIIFKYFYKCYYIVITSLLSVITKVITCLLPVSTVPCFSESRFWTSAFTSLQWHSAQPRPTPRCVGQPPCGGHISRIGGAKGMMDGLFLSYLLA